jgi:hypothetical protein
MYGEESLDVGLTDDTTLYLDGTFKNLLGIEKVM